MVASDFFISKSQKTGKGILSLFLKNMYVMKHLYEKLQNFVPRKTATKEHDDLLKVIKNVENA